VIDMVPFFVSGFEFLANRDAPRLAESFRGRASKKCEPATRDDFSEWQLSKAHTFDFEVLFTASPVCCHQVIHAARSPRNPSSKRFPSLANSERWRTREIGHWK